MARTTTAPTLEQRMGAIEQRLAVLESERPGRKPKPMLAIRQRDVCAIDPTRDSSTCPDASIYRYQSGCHGAACRLKQHNAYERRKNGKAEAVAVAAPKKRAPRKAAAPKVQTPTKPTVAKRTRSAPKRAAKVTKTVSKRPAA